MMDATFWALIALVIFLALMVYLKVPGVVGKSLDGRAERIRDELEEARRLREEAQSLLAEYQRKRKEAEKEAGEIVAAAQREAHAIIEETKQKTEEYVARRNKLAEQKIAQAETEADVLCCFSWCQLKSFLSFPARSAFQFVFSPTCLLATSR